MGTENAGFKAKSTARLNILRAFLMRKTALYETKYRHYRMSPSLNLKNRKGRLKPVSRFELAPKSWTLIKAYSGALCKLGSVCDRTQ
ncbi:hypothetical protein, partial [Neisseria mucosa]|uniref:hypothetical protein n=1 Tax=Neisseria mucosa TaxID=488 RepID=UPI00280B578E